MPTFFLRLSYVFVLLFVPHIQLEKKNKTAHVCVSDTAVFYVVGWHWHNKHSDQQFGAHNSAQQHHPHVLVAYQASGT